MSDATILQGPWGQVIPLRRDEPGYPISGIPHRDMPEPRREFGLRRSMAGAMDLPLARPDDLEAQKRIKRLAREARAALGDNEHVCPSLIYALAARVTGLATAAEQLAAEAKSLGLTKAAAQLRDHAGLLETLSAEIEAERSPERQP